MDWWRDLDGGVRWLIAGGGFGVWALVLLAVSRLARPRRVEPDPTAFDAPGPEPVAIGATLANRWSLDRDAVAATVLDLAARDHVSVRSINGQVMVYVPDHRAEHPEHPVPGEENGETLTTYERMVMERLRRRARLSRDGSVPAEALTHAGRTDARRWWRTFRKAVYNDLARRGLARRRWPTWAILTMVAASLAAALVAGYAFMAAVYEHNDITTGGAYGAGALYGGFFSIPLLIAAFRHPRLRATPEGRTAAARWLGYRATLATDLLVGALDASGISSGGRRLAHAAGFELAPAAVEPFASLHRGSKRETWSPVTGQWRQVRIGYPRLGKSTYGETPGTSIAIGLFMLLFFVAPFGLAFGQVFSGDLFGDDTYLQAMFAVVFVVPLAPVVLIGGADLWRGVRDIGAERDVVEGAVLRIRHASEGKRTVWYVVVDDGRSDVLHPWKFREQPAFGVNARVRAEVSPHLHNARNVQVIEDGDPHSAIDGERELTAFERMHASDGPGRSDTEDASSGLPDVVTMHRLVGRPVELADRGQSETHARYLLGRSGSIHVQRMDRPAFDRLRPRFRRAKKIVTGIGDEAYRKSLGSMLLVRLGHESVMVHTLLVEPKLDAKSIQEAIARHVLGLEESTTEPESSFEPQR